MKSSLKMQHPTLPMRGDPRLYTLEAGLSPEQISAKTHELTLTRWREWREEKDAAEALRQRVEALQEEVADRNGSLMRGWRQPLEEVTLKYLALTLAQQTGLPRITRLLLCGTAPTSATLFLGAV